MFDLSAAFDTVDQYQDIKSINLDSFQQNILSSSLFSNPHPTVDGFANQMETFGDSFQQNILSSSLFSNPHPTVDGFANQMETELTQILNNAAPSAIDLGQENKKIGSRRKLMILNTLDVGSSGAGKLRKPNKISKPTALHAPPQTKYNHKIECEIQS